MEASIGNDHSVVALISHCPQQVFRLVSSGFWVFVERLKVDVALTCRTQLGRPRCLGSDTWSAMYIERAACHSVAYMDKLFLKT